MKFWIVYIGLISVGIYYLYFNKELIFFYYNYYFLNKKIDKLELDHSRRIIFVPGGSVEVLCAWTIEQTKQFEFWFESKIKEKK